jgi:dipeptidyl-peptidase 4
MTARVLSLVVAMVSAPVWAHGAAEQGAHAATASLVTVAEASDYQRTGTSADAQAFLDALATASPLIQVSTLGTTHEGKPIPMAILADPPVAGPEEIGQRTVVLLLGNIHAGEVAGKEALLALARDLALASDQGRIRAPERNLLLKQLVLVFAPNQNADGNDRFSPDNRPGQIGPVEMGTRGNAQGLDLNRDYVKLAAPETRALVRFIRAWDPAVVIDAHTTNGSHHRYPLTFSGPKHPAADPDLVAFVRDRFLPDVRDRLREKHGYETFWYGNFAENHTRWTTYPATPRYGEGYLSLRNRIPILSEAYAYAPYRTRVEATYTFALEVVRSVSEHRDEIVKRIRQADTRTARAGERSDIADESRDATTTIGIRTAASARAEPVTVLGFEEYDADGNRIPPAGPRDYTVALVNEFQATLTVPRPWAYAFPSELSNVAENLLRHGVQMDELREDIEIDATAFVVGAFAHRDKPFQGHRLLRELSVTPVPRTVMLPAGTFIVRTAQPLGTLAGILLEPQSEDGLAVWNFFDNHLSPGADFPVLRLASRSFLTLRSARMLEEERAEPKRLSYEDVHGSRRVNLSGSAVGGIDWLDDEHYLQRKAGSLRAVEARTGRSRTHPDTDTSAVAAALTSLPTIDDKAAGDLARRHFARLNETATGQVFEYEGDLYYAAKNASHAIRLTAHPAREELALLSPDGEFVAFVRDNDLYVVDVMTGTERAITQGGSDTLRHGKHSWLYFEELYSRSWRAFWWSSDGKHLAFFRTDTSHLPVFTIVDDVPRPQRIETERWSRPGEPNPHVDVFIASRAGGTPKKLDLTDYSPGESLVAWAGWSKAHGVFRLAMTDRVQTWLDLLEVSPHAGSPTRLLRETTDAWVEPQGDPSELTDGSFILPSERDGFRHLYHFEQDGSLRRQITRGAWDVRRIAAIDEPAEAIFFEGTMDANTQIHLYRVPITGGEPVRLTPAGGSHRTILNPANTLFIDTWSDVDSPPQVALRSIDGSLLRMIDSNPVHELDDWALGRIERTRVPSVKGNVLEIRLTFPPDFDPSRAYPVWMQTYAGPRAPTVTDAWGGGRLNDRLLAECGIIVVQADPYPASNHGAQSAWTAYKQLGVRELEDLTEVVAWLCNHAWVDPDRIGLSGHSYGGFMTAYAMTHSTLFAAGVSGAPVTDWRDYDTIYTERYMLTPQMNPEGYRQTSPVEGAKNLHGRLLLTHGMIDDNVHLQNAVRLTDALVRAEKQFELFYYPARRHGIGSSHYSRLIHDFILRRMKPDRITPARTLTPHSDLRAP